MCPGKILAEASLRIAMAMILWSFDISGDPEFKPRSGAVRYVSYNHPGEHPTLIENLAVILNELR